MKLFFNFLILTLFGASAFAASQDNLKVDKLIIGEATSGTKTIELNMGLGSANPKIKTNSATNKMQFANDGTTYKDFGSGSGGGGGTNLIPNFDFESGVTGWTVSGVTLTQQSYGVPGDGNLKYVSATATTVGAYFETDAINIPTFLQSGDLESGGIYTSVNGQWRVSMTVSGSVVSQTLASQTAWTKSPLIGQPAQASTMKVRYELVSVSGTSTFTLDDVYDGSLRPVSQNLPLENIFASAQGATWSSTAATWVKIPLSATHDSTNYPISNNCVSIKSSGPYEIIIQTQFAGNGETVNLAYTINSGAQQFDATDMSLSANASGTQEQRFRQYNANLTQGDVVCAYSRISATRTVGQGRMSLRQLEPNKGSALGSRCPNDISCENTFTFAVSMGGLVTQESLDIVNGNCSVASNVFTCNFNSGVFPSAPPNCVVAANPGANTGVGASVDSTSTNQLVYRTFTTTTAAANAQPVYLVCQKQGTDFVAKRTMEMFLSKTVTSTGNFLERMERVKVAGSCAVSTCTITNQSGSVSSITRASVGNYTVNFIAGTWSSSPVCSITTGAQSGTNGAVASYVSTPTTTSFNFITNDNTSGALADQAFDIMCMGPR